jgi:CspA family cold shock protein
MSSQAVEPAAKQPRERSYSMAMTGTVKLIRVHHTKRRWTRRFRAHHRCGTAGLKSLIEGQRISYDVEPDKKGKGPKAVNLVV